MRLSDAEIDYGMIPFDTKRSIRGELEIVADDGLGKLCWRDARGY